VLARHYNTTERHVRGLVVDVPRRLRLDDSVERAVLTFLAELELSPRSQIFGGECSGARSST
jgi:hypothetical protein